VKKSLKAALLSGLVFPGVGYFAVRRPARGVVTVVLSGVCLVYLIKVALAQATVLMDRIMTGDVPIDASGIHNLVATTSAASNTGMVNLASLMLTVCWLVSVVDGYRIGQQEDAQGEQGASGRLAPALHRPVPALNTKNAAGIPPVAADTAVPIMRTARPDELPQLLQLYRHLHAEDAALPAASIVDAAWQAMLNNPAMHVLVAEAAGAMGPVLVATATLIILPNLTRGTRPYALIENVVTDPAWRQRGIGTRVLLAAQRMAWEAGCYKVMLMTGSKKEATLRFYRNSGFIDGDKTGFIARPTEA